MGRRNGIQRNPAEGQPIYSACGEKNSTGKYKYEFKIGFGKRYFFALSEYPQPSLFLCVDISKHDNCCGCACFYNNWKNFKAAAGIAEGCTGYSKGQSNTAGRCAQQR